QPTGLTGRVDRSDRSKWNPSTTRDFNRFRSCNRISCGISPPHPINIKGDGLLVIQSSKHKTLLSFLPFSFPISICCSSLVSMAFEDALAGLPSLGKPYARSPRRGPSRASVRRIVAVVHGDRSDRSLW